MTCRASCICPWCLVGLIVNGVLTALAKVAVRDEKDLAQKSPSVGQG